jgi:hypothetical protein
MKNRRGENKGMHRDRRINGRNNKLQQKLGLDTDGKDREKKMIEN